MLPERIAPSGAELDRLDVLVVHQPVDGDALPTALALFLLVAGLDTYVLIGFDTRDTPRGTGGFRALVTGITHAVRVLVRLVRVLGSGAIVVGVCHPVAVLVQHAVQIGSDLVRSGPGQAVGEVGLYPFNIEQGQRLPDLVSELRADLSVVAQVDPQGVDQVLQLGVHRVAIAVDRYLGQHGADAEQIGVGVAVASGDVHLDTAGLRVEAWAGDPQRVFKLLLGGRYSGIEIHALVDQALNAVDDEVGDQIDVYRLHARTCRYIERAQRQIARGQRAYDLVVVEAVALDLHRTRGLEGELELAEVVECRGIVHLTDRLELFVQRRDQYRGAHHEGPLLHRALDGGHGLFAAAGAVRIAGIALLGSASSNDGEREQQ